MPKRFLPYTTKPYRFTDADIQWLRNLAAHALKHDQHPDTKTYFSWLEEEEIKSMRELKRYLEAPPFLYALSRVLQVRFEIETHTLGNSLFTVPIHHPTVDEHQPIYRIRLDVHKQGANDNTNHYSPLPSSPSNNKPVPVAGDGNCLAAAVAYFIHTQPTEQTDEEQLEDTEPNCSLCAKLEAYESNHPGCNPQEEAEAEAERGAETEVEAELGAEEARGEETEEEEEAQLPAAILNHNRQDSVKTLILHGFKRIVAAPLPAHQACFFNKKMKAQEHAPAPSSSSKEIEKLLKNDSQAMTPKQKTCLLDEILARKIAHAQEEDDVDTIIKEHNQEVSLLWGGQCIDDVPEGYGVGRKLTA